MPNPSTIRRQAKRFKEIGSVKNRKVNRRRHVLTEETLDEIGQRNWTEIRVSVWEQRQYADPLVGKPTSQGRERQPSLAARSIWEALYIWKCYSTSASVWMQSHMARSRLTCHHFMTFSPRIGLKNPSCPYCDQSIATLRDFYFTLICHIVSIDLLCQLL